MLDFLRAGKSSIWGTFKTKHLATVADTKLVETGSTGYFSRYSIIEISLLEVKTTDYEVIWCIKRVSCKTENFL